MGSNPSYYSGDNKSVERVSWYDAVEFCNALSVSEGLTAYYAISGDTVTLNPGANGYRLPTEAEWEYTCRAGTTTAYNTGSSITSSQANYYGDRGSNGTVNVGSYAPNAWGLYDMHGNVWEWCRDWFGSYSGSHQTDPTGAASDIYRVLRGGSWDYGGRYLRSAYRDYYSPAIGNYGLGFRLVRSSSGG